MERVRMLQAGLRIALSVYMSLISLPWAVAQGQATFDWNDEADTPGAVRSCLASELRSFGMSGVVPREQWVEPSPARRINFNHCCRGASSAREFPQDWKIANNPLEDIYASGAEWDQRALLHSTRFDFQVPSTVGTKAGLLIREVDAYPPEVSARSLVEFSLAERGLRETASVSYLDSGGFSDVFRVRTLEGDTEVIKVRRSNPRLDLIEAGLRRDLALETVAAELAAQARYDHKPFVRVERWISSAADLQRGVIRQRVVEGPKVWELSEAVSEVERLGGRPMETLQPQDRAKLESAERVLHRADLTAVEARDRILALEDFYRTAHDPVLAFCAENQITPVRNKKKNGVIGVVGLDYNSGRNAAWDPDSRQFVIFDW